MDREAVVPKIFPNLIWDRIEPLLLLRDHFLLHQLVDPHQVRAVELVGVAVVRAQGPVESVQTMGLLYPGVAKFAH